MTFPSLVPCDLPHVQISQVLSLCYAIPTSLQLSQDLGLDCFLLILLPAPPVLSSSPHWSLMVLSSKGHKWKGPSLWNLWEKLGWLPRPLWVHWLGVTMLSCGVLQSCHRHLTGKYTDLDFQEINCEWLVRNVGISLEIVGVEGYIRGIFYVKYVILVIFTLHWIP
jgi:hypothetical protein